MVEKVQIKHATLYCRDWPEVIDELSPVDSRKTIRPYRAEPQQLHGNRFSYDNLATRGFIFLMRLLRVNLLEKPAVGATNHFFIDWRMYTHLYDTLKTGIVSWDSSSDYNAELAATARSRGS